MKAVALICFVALSTLSQAQLQVSDPPPLKFQQNVEEKLSQTATQLSNEIQAVVEAFNVHYQSKLNEGQAHIEKVVNDALLQLEQNSHMFSVECLEETKAQLHQAKHSAVYNFFHCKNMSDVLIDAGEMVSNSIFVVGDLINVVSEAKGSFSDCFSFNPFKSIPCYISEISKTVGRMSKMYSIVKEYKASMARLNTNLKNSFEICIHPDVNGIAKQVEAIMEKAHSCK